MQMSEHMWLNPASAATAAANTPGELQPPNTPGIAFAVHWLLVTAAAALIYWVIVVLVFRRRTHATPQHLLSLYSGLFLASFAAANLYIVDNSFALLQPMLTAPLVVLFALYYYLFPDPKYAGRWVRLLTIIYAFAELTPLFPSQTTRQSDFTPPTMPALIGTLDVIRDVPSVMIILIGVVPQIYARYRELNATGTRSGAEEFWSRWRYGAAMSTVVVLLASFVLFLISGVLALNPPSPVLGIVRSLFYLIVVLVPPVAGFAQVSRRLYDVDAIRNRALVYIPLTAALLLVYGVCLAGLVLLFPDFVGLPTLVYVPFILLLALLLWSLFRPLREQIQTNVDRRYFRRRYDAARVLDTVRATLYESGHLDQLSQRLVIGLQKAFEPADVTLWLRAQATGGAASPPLLDVSPVQFLASRGGPDVSDARAQSARGAPEAIVASLPEVKLHRQAGTTAVTSAAELTLTLPPGDTLRPYLVRRQSVVDLPRLTADSEAARTLQTRKAQIAVSLVSRGEIVGLLALGKPAGGMPYTLDERALLIALADVVSPALNIALHDHEQDVIAQHRDRVEQELQTARRIQGALLPKTVPALAGWRIATYYQPAREVGGDFYDFLQLPDGRLGLVLGDVTDKGIPAALVMATTRSMLRAVGVQPGATPGQVLAQVNDLLCADLPSGMFVTCFYAILDPATGVLRFANAGQDVPYHRSAADGRVRELMARGMPLGLMPDMTYDEREATLQMGDMVLFYSDGLVEAHNPARDMFGFPRLSALLGTHTDGSPLTLYLLQELASFTGPEWEQEDDITLVTLQHADEQEGDGTDMTAQTSASDGNADHGQTDDAFWRTLDEWTLPSAPGNERQAIARVVEVVRELPLRPSRLEQLKTAVGEATMNAMEHGNHYQPDLPVTLRVLASASAVAVRITDEGGESQLGAEIPEGAVPDLDAKLAGLQSPRGWGIFLIRNLVDEVHVSDSGHFHTLELIQALDDSPEGSATPGDSSDTHK